MTPEAENERLRETLTEIQGDAGEALYDREWPDPQEIHRRCVVALRSSDTDREET